MSLLFPDLVTDADGVYQPLPAPWLQAALLGFGVVAAVLITFSKGGPWMSFVVPIGLGIGFAVRAALEWRRWGPRGQPLVQVAGGVLRLKRAHSTAADFEHPLAQLTHLIVYGAVGQRIYRCVQPDGRWCEARPQWKPRAEALVIEFLQQRLRERLVVEEPQTVFAQARGDGPYFGS